MHMEAFSLPDAISKSLDDIESQAKEKCIAVTSSIEPSWGQVIGNGCSISAMITNLLFNAIKYTPKHQTVDLKARDHGDQVQIDISDTGIGIPADEVGKVFDEFYRASNAQAFERDGTGLGLSLAKQIVAQHAGTISVQSQQGQGTTLGTVGGFV